MDRKYTTKEWINIFNSGKFENTSRNIQIEAGWYDWFCRDTSLINKTRKMGNIIKQIRNSKRIDLNNTYVMFKNNCPMSGSLFDDFRIVDINTGDVVYTITIESPYTEFKFDVYGRENEFQSPVISFNKQRELVKWLNGEDYEF